MANTKIPIVTARGILRFDILRELVCARLHISEDGAADNMHYFKGIKTFLAAHGYRVYHTSVGWGDRVQERAQQLAEQIMQVLQVEGTERVHLIGHSMGGLDARYMLVNVPGMADRVAQLTTIGAPHYGTSLADLALNAGGRVVIQALMPYIHLDGFENLTRSSVAEFNVQALDREAKNPVVYQTYASVQEDRAQVFWPLQFGWTLLEKNEGPNDGLVSLHSQGWCSQLVASDGTTKVIRQKRFPFPADHLNQCGWWEPNELHDHPSSESLSQQIADYENQVKQVYLEIAESLEG